MREQIVKLRNRMKEENIDMYLILSDDYHSSEYVGDFFKCREYVSGFTGSAGSVVVTMTDACLWTDGRYFIQATSELEGSGIRLYKMGEEGVPNITDYIKDNLREGETLGFNGKSVPATLYEKLSENVKGKLRSSVDLVGDIWTNRPSFPKGRIYALSEKYTGMSFVCKIEKVRLEMEKKGVDYFVLSSLDDIAWLYNIRGEDIAYNPVAMAYSILGKDSAFLYLSVESMDKDCREILEKGGVSLKSYNESFPDARSLSGKILVDKRNTSAELLSHLKCSGELIYSDNPTIAMKAVKTKTEMDNERKAHIEDGIALTKLIYWIKHEPLSEKLTELSVCDKLEALRKEREGYLYQSFAPIVASGKHGAIVHYDPDETTNIPILNDTFVLMDTGGQYLTGTTDVTRTVSIGTVSAKMKKYYTAVLKGHLMLGNARFKYGTTGQNLDYIARKPLWDIGLDYNHGTGHGVGYLLNVHEGPQSIRMKAPEGSTPASFEEGMITSNEPGVYIEGEFGIRTENLVMCLADHVNEFGRFMKFETLTLVPYDRASIETEDLSEEEIKILNEYNRRVYEALSPYLSEEERTWLKGETDEIQSWN